jgi:hypothetical protein
VIAVLATAVVLSACSTTEAHIVEAWVTEEAGVVGASPDARTLRLSVGSCNADLTTAVEETSSRVTVTVTARNNTSDDCLDGLTIRLDEPLGQRELVDGVTGKVVSVRHIDS